MGMFGRSLGKAAQAAEFDPSALSGRDRLAFLGATLKDVGASLRGGESDTVMQLQQMLAGRQRAAQQQDFLKSLGGRLGGQGGFVEDPATPTGPGNLTGDQPDFGPPRAPGLNINSPDLPMLALKAQQLGVPITTLLDVMKAQQPDVHYDRGFGYNGKTGAAMGEFHPDLDKGQTYQNGAVSNLPGAVDAAASMAGGVEGAKSRAQAPFQFQTVTGPDGRPRVVSAETMAALGSNGGIIAAGPSAAQTEADKMRAAAGAQAQIGLPQANANAEQALGLIASLKSHPALGNRTGLKAMLPAIPGTGGADFDAMASQLKGKVFLEAFGSLKGAGQITEVEGKKATDAIARLNQTQSRVGYLKALGDLESVIRAGASRAQGQASGLQPAASGRPASVSSIPVADRMAEARRRGLIK